MLRTIAILALMTLAACGSRQDTVERDTNLHMLRNVTGAPEEFSIVPSKPLQAPESYSELPPPTPGQSNRTDLTPLGDAVAALGGNPARLEPQPGVPSSDQALIASASRFGRDPAIRDTLAAEDLQFRKRRALFNWRLVPTDTYNRVYSRQALDPYSTLYAARRAGAGTPAAPPPN